MKNLNIVKNIGFANYFGKHRFAPDFYIKKPPCSLLLKLFQNTLNFFLFLNQSLLWNRILCEIVKDSVPYICINLFKKEKIYFYKE
jgi:tRNA(Glu) U13 pseudouridine synthase TruD